MHWPKGRADKVLAKRKNRQYTGQKEKDRRTNNDELNTI
jgi:hypothetical protein